MRVLQHGRTYQSIKEIRDIVSDEPFEKGTVFKVINEKGSGYILEDVDSEKYVLIDFKQSDYLR